MKISIKDKEGKEISKEGNPRECVEWLFKSLDKQEIEEIKKKMSNGEFDFKEYFGYKVDMSDSEAEDILQELKTQKNICCLCGKEFEGFGNNAMPLKEGKCCDSCNLNKVIPARLNINENGKDWNGELKLRKETYDKVKRKIDGTDETVESYVNKIIQDKVEQFKNIDLSVIEDSYKIFDIPDIDRLKNYQLVVKRFINAYKSGKSAQENKEFDELSEEEAAKQILRYEYYIKPVIDEAKVFELDEEIIPVLKLNDVGKQNFPFNNIVIDTRVQILDRIYFAFIIGSYYTEDNISYKAINTVYAKKGENGTYELNDNFIFMDETIEKEFIGDKNPISLNKFYFKEKKYHREVRKFIYAFLNYINSPDVIVKELPYNPKNNQRRVERKSLPLPPTNKIYIHGTNFRRYVDEVNQGVRKFGYSCRFWVRGHFERFRNKIRYRYLYNLPNDDLEKRGFKRDNDGTIMKWKNAYLKGSGLIREKTYNVTK